jgi:phosphotransferase family enzyme
MTTATWRDPRFLAAADTWLRDACRTRAIELVGPIEQIHLRPWSTVFRAAAGDSAVFLKACSVVQAHEPGVIELVARESSDLVPRVIARHPSEPWILLQDGGDRLRLRMPGAEQLAVWRDLLPRYAVLQRSLVRREADLLLLGLPDRRLDRVPDLLARVVDDDRWAPREPRSRIRALLPTIRRACAELAESGIGASLDHDDLHDHNVLVHGDRAAIIDWGDASLTHPFLTLAVTLRFAAQAAGVPSDAPEIHALRDAYLEPWTGVAPADRLRRAADIGSALGVITGGLTWYEVVTRLEGAHAQEPGEMAATLGRIVEAIARLARPSRAPARRRRH